MTNISRFDSDELKRTWVPRMVRGEATGSICGATARVCATLGADTRRADVEAVVHEIGDVDALIDTSGYYVNSDWLDGGDARADLLKRTMAVNVRGPVNLARACVPYMKARGNGHMVVTGSLASRNAGSTLKVEPAYVASKGAMTSAVRYSAKQVAGRRVNGFSPGPALTALLLSADPPALRRRAVPDEAPRRAKGDRLAGGLACVPWIELHDRRGARRQGRHVLFVTPAQDG